MKDESKKYLLGCCTNKSCTEYGGGWKYPLNFGKEDQEDCSCPSCGNLLEFIIQNMED